MEKVTLLSHPLVLLIIGAVISIMATSIGFIIKSSIDNNGDHKEFKQAIMDLRELVVELKKEHGETRSKLDNLLGVHQSEMADGRHSKRNGR